MVSRIAAVIDTPGTKGIIDPIITISILSPKPICTAIYESIEIIIEATNLSIKNVSLNLDNLSNKNKTIELTTKLPIKSNNTPPNKKEKAAEAKPPDRNLKNGL